MTAATGPASLIVDDGLATHLPAGLRLWRLAPRGGDVFSTTGERDAEPVWRIIPGPGDDGRGLAWAERALDDVAWALRTAELRLLDLSNPASFTRETAVDYPESMLRAALPSLPGTPPDEISFSLTDWVSPAWERADAAFRSALAHLERLVNGRTWVETARENQILARTMLGRAGDRATVWGEGISGADRVLHTRAVALAQRSALTFVRTITLAIRGATLLASMVSGPAGMLFALPAVWAFVDDVIATVGGSHA